MFVRGWRGGSIRGSWSLPMTCGDVVSKGYMSSTDVLADFSLSISR